MKKLENKKCICCEQLFTPRVETATLCSKKCMYVWRKKQNWITKKCLHCNKDFEARKKDKLPRLFCSPECHKKSDYKKQKISDWSSRVDNPFKDPKKQEDFRKIKMRKYGTLQVNREQGINTCIRRYGTTMPILLSKRSAGIRVSKIQKQVYEHILKKYTNTILEYHVDSLDIFVDIFIPEINTIVEVYGDYWHCNPEKFEKSYYHRQLHMTADEKWNYDKNRQEKLVKAGYNVHIIWEKTVRNKSFFRINDYL